MKVPNAHDEDDESSEKGGLGLTSSSESPEEDRSSSLLSSPITSEEEEEERKLGPGLSSIAVMSSPREYAQRGSRGMDLISATGSHVLPVLLSFCKLTGILLHFFV